MKKYKLFKNITIFLILSLLLFLSNNFKINLNNIIAKDNDPIVLKINDNNDKTYYVKSEQSIIFEVDNIVKNEIYEIKINDLLNQTSIKENALITLFIIYSDGKHIYPGPYESGQWYSNTPGGIKFIANETGPIFLQASAYNVNDGGSFKIQISKIKEKITIKNYNEYKTKNSWQKDLYYFSKWLLGMHPAPFENVKKEELERRINQLFNEIPNLYDYQIAIRFMEIAAMLKDGHTYINDRRYFTELPIRLIWLQDGLYIKSASADNVLLIGNKVEKIGKYKVVDVLKKISSLISSENKYWTKYLSTIYLIKPEILYEFGIIDSKETVPLTLISNDKSLKKIELKSQFFTDDEIKKFVSIQDIKENREFLFEKNQDKNYWYEYLPQYNTLYFKYNLCFEMKDMPFKKFNEILFNKIEEFKPEKFIIDIRNNPGGYPFIINPFIEKIKNSYLNENGKLFVVTNNSTFSAGVIAAYTLKKETEAILIGEPVGNKLNFYGGAQWKYLPNTSLLMGYSTIKLNLSEKDLNTLNPDYNIKFNSKQYFKLVDPVLKFIFNVF